jgi:hypothetical protein
MLICYWHLNHALRVMLLPAEDLVARCDPDMGGDISGRVPWMDGSFVGRSIPPCEVPDNRRPPPDPHRVPFARPSLATLIHIISPFSHSHCSPPIDISRHVSVQDHRWLASGPPAGSSMLRSQALSPGPARGWRARRWGPHCDHRLGLVGPTPRFS